MATRLQSLEQELKELNQRAAQFQQDVEATETEAELLANLSRYFELEVDGSTVLKVLTAMKHDYASHYQSLLAENAQLTQALLEAESLSNVTSQTGS